MVESCYAGFLNLDSRTDRLAHMVSELNRVDLKAVRHRGRLPHEFDLNRAELATMRNRTPGAIGCFFGQTEIMMTAKDLALNAMVFEDDVVFCSDFQERLKIIEEFHVKHEWDIIWLGGTFHVPAFWHKVGGSGMPPNCSRELGKDCETTDHPRMIRTYGAFSTYAYIVNLYSIDKVLSLLEKSLSTTIGIDYSMISFQPDLKTFAFVPGCCKQMDNMSNIGTGMTVFSGFSRLNGTEENSRYWWQDKMEMFDPTKFEWR